MKEKIIVFVYKAVIVKFKVITIMTNSADQDEGMNVPADIVLWSHVDKVIASRVNVTLFL
jgi:hypothetical protein